MSERTPKAGREGLRLTSPSWGRGLWVGMPKEPKVGAHPSSAPLPNDLEGGRGANGHPEENTFELILGGGGAHRSTQVWVQAAAREA